MTIVTTATFDSLFNKLDEKIQEKASKKTGFFLLNPFHPSLRTEKLHPKKFHVWSFRIDRSYRIIFRFLDGEHVEFLFIGHHNQIYNYDIFR